MSTTITTDFAGQVNVLPRIVRINTDSSFATVTADNYLQNAISQGFTFYPSDIVAISFTNETSQFFTLAISSNVISLIPMAANIILPVTDGHVAAFSGTQGNLADGGLAVTKLLSSSFASPDISPNLVTFDVTCGQAALAAGGSVTLYTSSGSKQYKVRNLIINSGGTAFSGGGGNRLGQITDNTTVYSVIPAANLQTLTNNVWGVSTPLPLPAAAAANTSTAAGASLVFKYSGGTTDYTAGSIVVSGILERVA